MFCYPLPCYCFPAPQPAWTFSHFNDLFRQREFPPVNIAGLEYSARRFQQLMKEAQLLIGKIVESSDFARQLMGAAQESNQQRVDQLIRSTGISVRFRTDYSPSGIRIYLDNAEKEGGCCELLLGLRW
jgi:hypothetical protein